MSSIPYYPTREAVVRLLPKYIIPREGTRLLDLGSGDGRVLDVFGRYLDDIYLMGVERDIRLCRLSAKRLSRYGERASIVMGDLFKFDLGDYDIIYCYLTRDALERLRDVLVGGYYEGKVFIAYDIPIPYLRPRVILPIRELPGYHRLYIYYSDEHIISRKVDINI
jgi:SAM-dependent methyltransferase